MSEGNYRFGWLPDIPDHRDFRYAAPTPILKAIPAAVDLTSQAPKEIYDQGDLGSCTANAIAGALEFDEIKQKSKNVFTPSRLFIYYNERVLEHTVNADSGAFIRDGIKSVASQGVCPETEWPYDIAQFTKRPSQKCYTDARKFEALTYQRLFQDLHSMKGCLAEGYPFVYGFSVYESMMTQEVAKTGQVPLPGPTEKMVGGHAVMAVGFDDKTRLFKFRNSWGSGWGQGGYGFIPYSYLTDSNMADDFWTIRTVGPTQGH